MSKNTKTLNNSDEFLHASTGGPNLGHDQDAWWFEAYSHAGDESSTFDKENDAWNNLRQRLKAKDLDKSKSAPNFLPVWKSSVHPRTRLFIKIAAFILLGVFFGCGVYFAVMKIHQGHGGTPNGNIHLTDGGSIGNSLRLIRYVNFSDATMHPNTVVQHKSDHKDFIWIGNVSNTQIAACTSSGDQSQLTFIQLSGWPIDTYNNIQNNTHVLIDRSFKSCQQMHPIILNNRPINYITPGSYIAVGTPKPIAKAVYGFYAAWVPYYQDFNMTMTHTATHKTQANVHARGVRNDAGFNTSLASRDLQRRGGPLQLEIDVPINISLTAIEHNKFTKNDITTTIDYGLKDSFASFEFGMGFTFSLWHGDSIFEWHYSLESHIGSHNQVKVQPFLQLTAEYTMDEELLYIYANDIQLPIEAFIEFGFIIFLTPLLKVPVSVNLKGLFELSIPMSWEQKTWRHEVKIQDGATLYDRTTGGDMVYSGEVLVYGSASLDFEIGIHLGVDVALTWWDFVVWEQEVFLGTRFLFNAIASLDGSSQMLGAKIDQEYLISSDTVPSFVLPNGALQAAQNSEHKGNGVLAWDWMHETYVANPFSKAATATTSVFATSSTVTSVITPTSSISQSAASVFSNSLTTSMSNLPRANRVITYTTLWSQYQNPTAQPKAKMPSWCAAYSTTPANMNPNLVTHMIYHALGADQNGTVTLYEWNDLALIQEMVALKSKNPSLKVMASVGGWTFSIGGSSAYKETTFYAFPMLASSAVTRTAFANSLLKFCKDNALDGIDLDWEYPVKDPPCDSQVKDKTNGICPTFPENALNFILLVQTIYNTLVVQNNLLFSVALPAGLPQSSQLDLKQVAAYSSWINLMTYDYYGRFDTPKLPPSPAISCATKNDPVTGKSYNWDVLSTLQYYSQKGVPLSQISVGFEFVGRPNSGNTNISPCTLDIDSMSYFELEQLVGPSNFGPTDPLLMASSVTYQGQYYGFDTIDSVQLKACYYLSLGFTNLMSFDMNADSITAGYPLSKALWNVANNPSSVCSQYAQIIKNAQNYVCGAPPTTTTSVIKSYVTTTVPVPPPKTTSLTLYTWDSTVKANPTTSSKTDLYTNTAKPTPTNAQTVNGVAYMLGPIYNSSAVVYTIGSNGTTPIQSVSDCVAVPSIVFNVTGPPTSLQIVNQACTAIFPSTVVGNILSPLGASNMTNATILAYTTLPVNTTLTTVTGGNSTVNATMTATSSVLISSTSTSLLKTTMSSSASASSTISKTTTTSAQQTSTTTSNRSSLATTASSSTVSTTMSQQTSTTTSNGSSLATTSSSSLSSVSTSSTTSKTTTASPQTSTMTSNGSSLATTSSSSTISQTTTTSQQTSTSTITSPPPATTTQPSTSAIGNSCTTFGAFGCDSAKNALIQCTYATSSVGNNVL
ncbi:hypothetical protein HDU76_008317, partial [Blyttiomyces sp. JEL0837]